MGFGIRSYTHQQNPGVLPNLMVLCRGQNSDGIPFWAYLCMVPAQAEMFYEARRKGRLDLDDYGTILEHGEGKEPPLEVRDRMHRDFGMRDDYEDMLIAAIKKLRG